MRKSVLADVPAALSSDYWIIPDESSAPALSTARPSVSFCIATKNRERTIRSCLESIRAQQYPGIEIVVVDNGSSDSTREIAATLADTVADQPGPLGAARRRAVELSSGDLVAIFDDDIVIPHTEWLLGATARFGLSASASTVWPVLVPPAGAGLVTQCFFDLHDAIFEHRMRRATGVVGGANAILRRSAVEAVGGIDPRLSFGDDHELALRLRRAGYRVILHKDPLIHDTQFSLSVTYRKQKWGAEAVREFGPEVLSQTYADMLTEQVVVGGLGMLRGVRAGRLSWIAFPPLLAAKCLAYGPAILRREGDRRLVPKWLRV